MDSTILYIQEQENKKKINDLNEALEVAPDPRVSL